MTYYTRFNTPFCEVILVGDEKGLSHLHLNTGKGKREFQISESWEHNAHFFADAQSQIEEYFSGKRKTFSITLNPSGTPFQKSIWNKLTSIPYGQVRSYKNIAVEIGNPNSSRAVGMANSKNPIPLIVPCHRVIGANGKLTGFAHGLEFKERLLRLEGYYL